MNEKNNSAHLSSISDIKPIPEKAVKIPMLDYESSVAQIIFKEIISVFYTTNNWPVLPIRAINL